MTHDPREALEVERAELVAKNEAATSWGAAVGIRHERIKEIDRELALTAPAPKGEPAAWRWRFEDQQGWMLRAKKPACADDRDVQCEPLYTSPPPAAGWDEAISLVREADTLLQGGITKNLRLDKADYDRLVAIFSRDLPLSLRRESPASSGVASIVTCCVTGAIPSDGGACGDCDPCLLGEASVPDAVKRLIAEKNGLIQRVGELRDASRPDAGGGVREALANLYRTVKAWQFCPADSIEQADAACDRDDAMDAAKAALSTPSDAVNESAEADFPAWTEEDEAYGLGRRDGYESAIQDLDLATGGDGEFKGSTIPGETVDVETMKQRVISRIYNESAEARLREALIALDERLRACGSLNTAEDAYDSFYQEIVSEALSPGGDEAKKSEGGLAPGCCSAVSPCVYQKREPTTICDTCKAAQTSGVHSDPPDRGEIVALGDLVTVNELAPFFSDWRGVKLKVVGLHLAPDGKQWADVIEGDQRHRGNGIYDGETDGFDVLWLSKVTALDGVAGE